MSKKSLKAESLAALLIVIKLFASDFYGKHLAHRSQESFQPRFRGQ